MYLYWADGVIQNHLTSLINQKLDCEKQQINNISNSTFSTNSKAYKLKIIQMYIWRNFARHVPRTYKRTCQFHLQLQAGFSDSWDLEGRGSFSFISSTSSNSVHIKAHTFCILLVQSKQRNMKATLCSAIFSCFCATLNAQKKIFFEAYELFQSRSVFHSRRFFRESCFFLYVFQMAYLLRHANYI